MLYDKKWDVDVVGKTLLDAADYIEQHGWCQHKLSIKERVCVMGAIGIDKHSIEAERRLINHIKNNAGPNGVYSLISWNDAPDQTKENVIETLRQVARQSVS